VRAPTLVALVAHARDVPSDAREAFATALEGLTGRRDAVVLHTCQRVELYLTSSAEPAPQLPPLPPGCRRLEDDDAARHLIRVVCGLESAVLGEEQVLHQVRSTLAGRRALGPLDGVLDRLFQVALHAGRRAHSWYPHPRPSLADAALAEIEQRAGSLAGQPVLVVGAGMMGRLAARTAARRGALVRVTNRSPQRARQLAAAVGGHAVPWPQDQGAARPSGGRGEDVAPVRGVIVAVGGLWPVAAAELAGYALRGVVVADLSSPPALDAAARARLGERYLSVDSFAWRKVDGLGQDLQDRLESLVQDSGAEYCGWLRARVGGPTIHRLTTAAERRREEEVAWLRRRLPDLSDREVALIEQMSRRLVAGLLHPARRAIHDDETGELGRAARALFALPDPLISDDPGPDLAVPQAATG
jgi:glutamyl-tRNA reductase